tara:strand:+ start:53 stop:631 length:579 start_codon:yes stop_codon:yes gene_type:complete
MSITINGNGTVTGISAGGLPAGCITSATLASGVGGKVLQIQTVTKTNQFNETLAAGAISSSDISGLQVTITPSSSSNKILLTCSLTMSSYDNGFLFYKNGSVISGATGDADGTKKRIFAEQYLGSGYTMFGNTFQYVDTAGGTSAITYGPRIKNTGSASRIYYVNVNHQGRSAVSKPDLVGASTFTAMEIAA